MREATGKALEEVEKSLQHQKDKWGVQRHDLPVWATVLGEELGEINKEYGDLCRAVLNVRWAIAAANGAAPPAGEFSDVMDTLLAAIVEASQVAAVSVAMIEHMQEVYALLEAHKGSAVALTNVFEGLDGIFSGATHRVQKP